MYDIVSSIPDGVSTVYVYGVLYILKVVNSKIIPQSNIESRDIVYAEYNRQ